MHTYAFLRLTAVLMFALTFVVGVHTDATHARSKLDAEPQQCARVDLQCHRVFLPLVMHSPQSRVGPFDFVGSYIPDEGGSNPAALSTVVISGSTAFMSSDHLHVIDVREPTKPTLISSLLYAGSHEDSGIAGTTWVGTDNSFEHGGAPVTEANVVDVRNLRKPVLRRTLGMGAAWWNGLDTVRNTLYLVQGGWYPYPHPTPGSMLVYNLSDPAKPVFRGSYDLPTGHGVSVEVQNNLAYVGTKVPYGPAGLTILDVSNPVSITLRSSLVFTATEQSDIAIGGGVAYVGTYETGFAMVNVKRPDEPHLIGHYATKGSVQRLSVEGDLLYVLTQTDHPRRSRELQVFDVRDPALPQFLGSYRGNGTTNRIADFAVEDDLVYLATGNGLQILRYRPDEAIPSTTR